MLFIIKGKLPLYYKKKILSNKSKKSILHLEKKSRNVWQFRAELQGDHLNLHKRTKVFLKLLYQMKKFQATVQTVLSGHPVFPVGNHVQVTL